MELREVLEALSSESLKTMAKKAGMGKIPVRKAEVITAIETYFQKYLPEWLALLTPGQRLFLSEAVHGSETVRPDSFRAKYGQQCPEAIPYLRSREAELIHLVLFAAPGGTSVAEDIAVRLKELLPAAPPLVIRSAETIPDRFQPRLHFHGSGQENRGIHVYQGEAIVLQELRRILILAQSDKLRVTEKSRRPTDAAVRLMGQSLAAPDFDLESDDEPYRASQWYESPGAVRAHAWGALVQQCGWCKATAGNLRLTAAGKSVVNAPDADALREGFNQFLFDDDFDEFNRIPNIRGQSGKGGRSMTPPYERRDAIAESMRRWPIGQWIEFSEAFRFLLASGLSFRVSENPWDLYFLEKQYGSMGYSHVGQDLERQYMRAFFMESMATLGLVDIAYTWPHHLWPELHESWGIDDLSFCGRYDGLLHIRLNPLGAFCLGVNETYAPPPAPKRSLFRVLPNRDLAVLEHHALTPAETSMLDRFAARQSDAIWRLEARRLLDFIEGGGKLEEITEFLNINAEGEIPQPVSVFLSDLAGGASAISGREDAWLVETRDERTALLIAHDPRAGKYCRHAGERFLVVARRNERAFRTALKEMGFVMPA
ncbi:MAG: hypothetical protein NTX50_08850 [Candidatus Sumerlaeota bacterium]|nr:hypothetical protein [Candidatus Sumerlaeota bacterium]